MRSSRHQLSMLLNMVRSAPWNPFPSWRWCIPRRERLHEKGGPMLCLKNPLIFMFVCTCPQQRFQLGVHVLQQLLNDFIHQTHFSVVAWYQVVVSPHHPTEHVLVILMSFKGEPQRLAFHLWSAFQSTQLATRPGSMELAHHLEHFASAWGNGSAKLPNSPLPCEVAQEVLLIPVSGRVVGAVCGDEEQITLRGLKARILISLTFCRLPGTNQTIWPRVPQRTMPIFDLFQQFDVGFPPGKQVLNYVLVARRRKG